MGIIIFYAVLVAIVYFIYKMFKKNKKATIFSIVGIVALIFIGNATIESSKEQDRLHEEIEWKSQCETVEGVERLINGTTWTYTETLTESSHFKKWIKLEFNNGQVSQWAVSPSEGQWGEPEVYNYTVEKARYSNTGESYIRVVWKDYDDCSYAFAPIDKRLYGAYDTSGDVIKNEDCNPWKD